jgi:hypothetical protein
MKEPVDYSDEYTHDVSIILCDTARQVKQVKAVARDIGIFTTIKSTIKKPSRLHRNPNYNIVYEAYFPELPVNSGWLLGYPVTVEPYERVKPMPSLTSSIDLGGS